VAQKTWLDVKEAVEAAGLLHELRDQGDIILYPDASNKFGPDRMSLPVVMCAKIAGSFGEALGFGGI
jgi:hypothetical protein